MTKLNIVVVEDSVAALREIKKMLEAETDWSVHLINPVAKTPYPKLEEVCDQIRKAAGDNALILLDHEFYDWGWDGEDIARMFDINRIICTSSVHREYAKHSVGGKDVLHRVPKLGELWIKKIKEMAAA